MVEQVSMAQVRATYKARDSWWTVLLVDPIAGRLVRLVAANRFVTPNVLTGVAFLLGLVAAGMFLLATPLWLTIGALVYFAGFVVDCMDGKIARLHGSGSVLGSWVDFILDRVRVVLCTVTLFVGQYLHTGQALFLYTALGVVFLALFGYVNGAEIDKAMARMSARTAERAGTGGRASAADPQLPRAVDRVRATLHRHRIRLNIVSGVEFEMAIFVVAPLVAVLTGPTALAVVAVVAGTLLLVFEVALVARFFARARAFDRTGDSPSVPSPRETQADPTVPAKPR